MRLIGRVALTALVAVVAGCGGGNNGWKLDPLADRDKNAHDLANAFA